MRKSQNEHLLRKLSFNVFGRKIRLRINCKIVGNVIIFDLKKILRVNPTGYSFVHVIF